MKMISWLYAGALAIGIALLLSACTVSSAPPSETPTVLVSPPASAVVATATPSPMPTATPRPDPPVAAA